MHQLSPRKHSPRSADAVPKPEVVPMQEQSTAWWSPDFSDRIYTAHRVAAVVGALTDAGVHAEALLAGSGLTENRLKSAATRVSYRQMIAVFGNALRLSPDPAFALRAGLAMRVTSYGMYGYAVMSSPSHQAALEFGVKYHRVLGPVCRVGLVLGDEGAMFTYDPILTRDPREDLYRAAVEFSIAGHFRLNKDLYGPSFRFAHISVVYPAPAHVRAYRQSFGCPVAFDQPFNQVSFDSKWLADPTPYSDPITNAMAREACEEAFARLDRAEGIASHVRRMLIENPGRFPSVEAMAAQLSMTPRMLHRKLEAEQTTYRALLGEVRMSLAIQYLRKTSITNEDIAARLGYSDAANFRHAFKRWTGKRPSDYRS